MSRIKLKMKSTYILFTFLALQLCQIGAEELEKRDVEEGQLINAADEDMEDLDMDKDIDDSDMEKVLTDTSSVELRARPSKRPFCMRTKRTGWGGVCVGPNILDMVGLNCDFIHPDDAPNHSGEEVCRNTDQVCCVDCFAPKQKENCPSGIGHIADVRRECCNGKHNLFTMDSGCKCCGSCSRTNYCKKYHGWCVYKHGEDYYNGRPNNYETCTEENGYRIKYKWCEGKTCACCMQLQA